MRKLFILLSLLLIAPLAAQATPLQRWEQELSALTLRGKVQYSWLWMDLYHAELWSKRPLQRREEIFGMPHALRLTYDRSFGKKLLVETSLRLLNDQKLLTEEQNLAWGRDLEMIFPSVRDGDQVAAVYKPQHGSIHFFFNGQSRGVIKDAEFSRRFMAIWLGADSMFPEKGLRLMGLAVPTSPVPYMNESEE